MALLEDHALHHLREAQALLRLAERFDGGRLEAACARAAAAGDGRYRTVKGLLERDLEQVEPEPPPPPQPVDALLRGPAGVVPTGAEGR